MPEKIKNPAKTTAFVEKGRGENHIIAVPFILVHCQIPWLIWIRVHCLCMGAASNTLHATAQASSFKIMDLYFSPQMKVNADKFGKSTFQSLTARTRQSNKNVKPFGKLNNDQGTAPS